MSLAELLSQPAPNWSNLYVNSITSNSFAGPSGATGNFDDLVTKNLFVNDVYPNGGNTGMKFHCPSLGPDPCFTFTALGTSNTNSSIVYIEDSFSAFDHPNAAMLLMNAPSSASYLGGTNFILARNQGASGGTAGAAPGGVTGGVTGGANLTNSIVFAVNSGGVVTSNGYYQYSSESYKKNIEPLVLNSKRLKDINPSFYHYHAHNDSDKKRLGIMYEEMEELCAEVCHEDELGKKIDLNAQIAILFSLLKDIEQRLCVLESKFGI